MHFNEAVLTEMLGYLIYLWQWAQLINLFLNKKLPNYF